MNTVSAPSPELLACIAHPVLRALAAQGVLRHYRRHTVVIEEGERNNTLYVVLAGRLRVYALSQDQRPRELTLGICGPGQLVGEMALDGERRCASVITLVPSVCVAIAGELVLAHMQQQPELAWMLMRQALARAREATVTARHALFSDAYTRLRTLLLRAQDASIQEVGHSPQPMTHAQMAQQIGCSREMVSRILKDLVRGGYVARTTQRTYQVRTSLPARW